MTTITFNMKRGELSVTYSGGTFTMSASSGRSPYTNDPRHTGRRNEGPIPVGKYYITTSELSDPGLARDVARNFRGDWGDWRVVLHPSPGTGTLGRSGFFLHGGSQGGSAGCIDFGGGLTGNADTDLLKKAIMEDGDGIVPVVVVP